MLRDYQQRSIDMLYDWMRNHSGNPCAVLPTGAGKSHIVAYLCKDAVQTWPETRILMLTHVKELIEQNAEKMREHWKNAPMGIYSASIGKRQLGEPITFAGIQSVRNKAEEIGHIDLVIIDECHLINHKDEGGYRKLIGDLLKINPHMRVIGLTATPWRLGHGRIDEGEETIFDGLVEPVTIEELIYKGFLAPLKSKITKEHLNVEGVSKRGGEFIESQLQKAVDKADINERVVDEVISLAGDRKAWLFFCTGIDHSEHIRDVLRSRGITCEMVTGKTPKGERARILADYKAGKIKALTNANVLTTGFDYPDIDLIAMLRPTLSPSLYVQMAGRGLRPKSHTDHCLVLDFAGVVEKHGPITAVQPPDKSGKGGDAPIKVCDNCDEICHASVKKCPECGELFPENEAKEKDFKLRQADIMGMDSPQLKVKRWAWLPHVSAKTGKEMIRITYYGDLSEKPISEYLCIMHGGQAGYKAMRTMSDLAESAGIKIEPTWSIADACNHMAKAKPPTTVKYRKNGKFFDVIRREYALETK
ncbi:helicase [Alteromonas phage PB15]|nr:helicase [Alteromonas phage PB15]